MYRELFEEVGLSRKDVRILAQRVTGCATNYRNVWCVGTRTGLYRPKTKMVSLAAGERRCEINMQTSSTPEFDGWRWVSYGIRSDRWCHLNVMSTVG